MSTGSLIGGVVGAVVGFVATGFNPVGAAYGFALGAAGGALLDPPKGPTMPGPRLADLSVQTSTYGAAIPRVYGTIGIFGNLMWLENNKLKVTVRKQKSGGKGGGGSAKAAPTYSYSATFHLGLCQGPIAGVRRIWCGDKLIYNAGSDDLETIIASNQNAAGFRIYLGSDDQMPDSRYEADVGVGNASAHRGMAYIAFYDFQQADYSNTLQAAQFKVEVVSVPSPETSVPVDIAPFAESAFGPKSGAALRGDFSGMRYLSKRQVGYAEMWDIHLGRPQRVAQTITGHGGDPLVEVRAAVSYDGAVWYVDQIDDLFDSTRITRQSDGLSFNIYQPVEVQYIRMIDDTNGVCLFGTVASANQLTTAALFNLPASPDFGVIQDTLVTPSGFRLSTAGDKTHAFKIVDNGTAAIVSVKLYDDLFNLGAEYNVQIPTGQFPDVSTSYPYEAGSSVNSCTLGGAIYLLRSLPLSGEYRVIALRDGEILDNYTFTVAPSGSVHPFAFYMVSATQGYVVADHLIQFARYESGPQALAQIVRTEVELSGLLGPGDINADLLTSDVRGYRVTGGTIRAALEPLQGAFPFDVVQSGYQIKCVPRGQASVATIPWEDLGATDGAAPSDILQQSREMDTQLPARTTIKYLDAAREYAVSEQYADRINTEAINRVDRDLPLVLTADEAAGVAEVLQNLPWLERTAGAFALPPTYLQLETADVITVTTPKAIYQLRLTEINYTPDGRLECKAKPNRAALYTPAATGGEGVAPIGTVPLAGNSIFLALDMPVVDETQQNDVGFVGVMTGDTGSWPGGLLVRSNDDGQTWIDLQGFTGKATLGVARGTLPVSPCTLIDQHTLVIDMLSGELESVTRDQMLSGVNYAAYGLDGRWEILRFQNATLQADGSYLLANFVRGEKGTEWATGLHAAGDYLVLLDDPDNTFIGSPVESIALDRLYRGVTSGASVDNAVDVPFTYRGVNLECLSPVYARGTRDGSSNLTINFTRRSRLSSSWWANGVAAPVGEASEAYEIDVMSGATVKRTISSAVPAATYSAADQTTDFGSHQASITLRIFQLSAVVGRGYPLEVTL